MDYDNLKECSNCGKYTTSLSASNRCHSCEWIENYVPDFIIVHCSHCDMPTVPPFEGGDYVCEWCGEWIDF